METIRMAWQLLRKEFVLEWRNRVAFNGIVLYVACVVFICYLSFHTQAAEVTPEVWSTLFWIVMLFAAVNAAAKSFAQEGRERMFYYYTIASAEAIILSKLIYNVMLLLLLGFVSYAFYSVVMGNPVLSHWLFVSGLGLGAIGLGASLTLISGIASKAGNNGSLMAVLGLPVMVPVLLMTMKLSQSAILGETFYDATDTLLALGAIDAIAASLSVILFPQVWRS
ncbi:cytochrome C biogenesis protein CcmB [Fulvitalea axinellae]|uniref:Cytochrome C biogenesis protein CcmB n=1 Tax=Fulvitalea axinellae TaxID=1182444 RepID=A0AAU9CN62_9BACT|nr:cytochrome C biogenesis protein CcmB [Fulvitalea axinellae]